MFNNYCNSLVVKTAHWKRKKFIQHHNEVLFTYIDVLSRKKQYSTMRQKIITDFFFIIFFLTNFNNNWSKHLTNKCSILFTNKMSIVSLTNEV